MKSYKISILIITFLILILYSGCTKKQTNYDEMVKVTYELEGGTYQNCTLPVVQYYDFGDTVLKQIKDPSSLTKNTIEKQEYYLVGWFLDKNIDGDKITYTNQWDFTNDTVKDDNITLYAYWHKNIKYTYQVCYYDETNELQTLGEYEVEQGEKFDDYEDVAFRPNYTVINFYDKAGNLWNPDFNHPGGDEDNNVLVIAKYIEGTYSVINSIRDLMKAKEKIFI